MFKVCGCGSRTFEAPILEGRRVAVVDNDGNVVATAEDVDVTGEYVCSDCGKDATEYVEDVEDVEDEEEEEEEEEEEKPKSVYRRTSKSEIEKSSKGKNRCPSGYRFGKDYEKYPECDDCDVWEDCMDAK